MNRKLKIGLAGMLLLSIMIPGVLALQYKQKTTVAIESNNMMFADGSMFHLEAHAGQHHFSDPIMGKLTITSQIGIYEPPDSCIVKITGGTITSTSVWLTGEYPRVTACSTKGLSGAFTLWADNTGSIMLENSDGATIASGMGIVVINNPPTTTIT